MQRTWNVVATSIYPLGVCFLPEGLHIAAVCEQKTECGLLLYDKNHKEGIRVPFPEDFKKGTIRAMLLKGYQDRKCSYLFYEGNRVFQDPYAKALEDRYPYGEEKKELPRCKVSEESYDWQNDRMTPVPFEESIFYLLHVRGFTKHRSSGVRKKGTYAGLAEKIPYLKELGITAALLMPAYEFDEILSEQTQPLSMEQAAAAYKAEPVRMEEKPRRLNYWGYQKGLYFMPKYAYASQHDAVREFKDMVKAFHQNQIEVMMQFYFPPEIDSIHILEILKYWVLEYHVDGFQLMGVQIPMPLLCKEPLFAETKLLYDKDLSGCERNRVSGRNRAVTRNFGLMHEAFLYDIRKLLKGDAGMIDRLMYLWRENDPEKGIVNYIAKQDGFRLYDLVSYNQKHNEANGESGQDGNDYNYSWNCGIEGTTRKKNILALRMRQMKNAMTFVLLAQGTPFIYGGDEFGNTQEGNNNPYCQDNPICWVKWNLLKTNEPLFAYTKELISLRKAFPILRCRELLRGTDYISCGYPDISFHGKEAWIPDTGQESRSLGILYCGRYAQKAEDGDDGFLYIGINMHWEPYRFALPQMAKDTEWVGIASSGISEQTQDAMETDDAGNFQHITVSPRTIVICRTIKRQEEKKKRTKTAYVNEKSMASL